MLSRDDFAKITASIRDASASMEARFVDMGDRLSTAVDTIGTLTLTFDRLADELKGKNLHDATQALSQIISRVAALARVHDDGRTIFGKLEGLTSCIQQLSRRSARPSAASEAWRSTHGSKRSKSAVPGSTSPVSQPR